jgi:hypothetical protein
MKTLVLCLGVLISLSSLSGCAMFGPPLKIQVFEEHDMIFVKQGDKIVRASGKEYIVPKDGAYMTHDVILDMGAKLKDR